MLNEAPIIKAEKNQPFVISIETSRSAKEVFDCLTNGIKHWWSEVMEGSANSVGDRFIVRFGDTFKDLEVVDLVRYKKVVWLCNNSHIDMTTLNNKSEWNGTRIAWHIMQNDIGITLRLEHDGLTPALECYDVCDQGWQHFVHSLESLLNTGKGQPAKLKK